VWFLNISMHVFICFLKNDDTTGLDAVFFGEFLFADFLFVTKEDVSFFFTRPGEKYSLMKLSRDSGRTWSVWRQRGEFLRLALHDGEAECLFNTCSAFAQTGIPFNRMDYCLYCLPIRVPEEIRLFDAQKLTDTQAVILIIRECLMSTSQICMALSGLNSRQTLAGTLHSSLLPVTSRVAVNDLYNLLPE